MKQNKNKQEKGFFWHVHHDKLMEYCWSYKKRVNYIRRYKPENEVETRLRLFKPVKGKLPKEFVEARETWEAWEKAEEAWEKAEEARVKAEKARVKAEEAWMKAKKARVEEAMVEVAMVRAEKTWEKHREAWGKAEEAWEAWVKVEKAREKVEEKHKDEIQVLHDKECPDCSWNGEQIIFEKQEN
jgi:hypothetical protein